MAVFAGLVKRSDKVAFYGVPGADGTVFHRMSKFTDISVSKNSKEYSRQYVDKDSEDTDVVGYSPSISYGFDQYIGNAVHEDIAAVHDDELLGDAAIRSIVWVDLTKEDGVAGSFAAIQRDFAVIPDSEGDSTDAYTYSGNLKVKSNQVKGGATTTDGWETCVFTAVID